MFRRFMNWLRPDQGLRKSQELLLCRLIVNLQISAARLNNAMQSDLLTTIFSGVPMNPMVTI